MARGGPSRGTLKFNQELSGVPSGELLKRLQALHAELVALDQDTVDPKSLDKVREKLINGSLLLGKDKGVKAYTCCCLADLLRLYAPEAPYSESELKDIFQFFIRQLKHFTGPTCPNYTQYFYLVESLSNIKSATLMATLPGAEQLMAETAKQFFDLAKPDMPKNVLSHFAEILCQVIDEADIIPADLVDNILCQFLPRNVKANPTSLHLAVEVCMPTAERLQQYVAQYFTEVLGNALEDADHDEDTDSGDDSRATSKGTKKAGKGKAVASASSSVADSTYFILTHELIKSITRSCPALLASVIPLLEEELHSENLGVRVLATRTLGEMFSDKPLEKAGSLPLMLSVQTARADLAKKYASAWRTWLGRSKDKAPAVRLVVLECCKDILKMHHELGRDIYDVLRMRLTDPDDRIRAAACSAFSTIDYDSSLHAFDKSTLLELAERIQDRKPSVQREALNSLGRMYSNAFGEISNGETSAIERFGWIPGEILKATLLLNGELYTSIERVLHDYLLPLPQAADEEAYHVERFLLVMHYLDDSTRKALLRCARIFEKRPLIYETYLNVCEKYNGGQLDADEDTITAQLKLSCQVVASQFPETSKAESDLLKFAKLNDHRTVKLLKSLMDETSNARTITKNVEEALRRIEKASASILETFAIFIRRSGFLILGQSCIPHLFASLRKSLDSQPEDEADATSAADEQIDSFGKISHFTLETIVKHCPILLKPHLHDLAQMLQEDRHASITEIVLHGLSSLVMADPDCIERDRAVLQKAVDLALVGTPNQAKYAATFLSLTNDAGAQCKELVQDLADALPASSGTRLLAQLNALKRLAKYAHEQFSPRAANITTFLTSQLKRPTLQSTPNRRSNMSTASDVSSAGQFFQDWCEQKDFLPEHEACIIGLQVLTNQALASAHHHADKDANSPDPGTTQLFKLLAFILKHQGRPSTFKTGPGLAGHLRLQAAISLLKLGSKAEYIHLMTPQFELFACTMQDAAFQVRSAFIHKFIRHARNGKIANSKLNVALFLTAHDPDAENRMMALRLVQDQYRATKKEPRIKHFDMLLVRLIHLLAHHPDFGTEVDDLQIASRYIELFLDGIANKENISLLYYLALKVKTVRDAQSKQYDQPLYVLSELAQYVIKSRAKLMGWTLQNQAVPIRMPGDIFKHLPDRETMTEIQKTVYISASDIEQIGEVGKPVKTEPVKKARQPKKAANGDGRASTSKAKAENGDKAKKPRSKVSAAANTSRDASTSTTKKRKKGRKEWEDDTEDEDEESESDEEGDSDIENRTAKESDSAAEDAKARPANLRQRPARTKRAVTQSSKPASKSEDADSSKENTRLASPAAEDKSADQEDASMAGVSAEAAADPASSPAKSSPGKSRRRRSGQKASIETAPNAVKHANGHTKTDEQATPAASPSRRSKRRKSAAVDDE